ncbi:MAG: ABC transporter substrate-binding protein [Lachnospiraceae bacterium]
MKKKLVSVLLTTTLLVSMTACGGSNQSKGEEENKEAVASDTTEASDTAEAKEGGTITFGDVTQSNGDMFPHWTNNASDYNAYKMSTGLGTIAIDKDGQYVYDDTVLADHDDKQNEDGSETWTYQLNDGLKWSNGDPVTAEDYVFYYLFWSSKVMCTDMEAQDAILVGQYLKGFDAYNAGETDTLEGIHLIDDKTFSVTIDKQYVPYYYGKALSSSTPEYMKGWVPDDVTIEETENGAKFSDNFTKEHIADTVKKFRYNPDVSSGPYTFKSYDKKANCYTLVKNENYPGNFEGQKPSIDTVIYKYIKEETMMDQLKTGAIDILTGCMTGSEIDTGLDMVDTGDFDYIHYARSGYGKLVFKCNVGPTQFAEVRHAIAYLLDRNKFAQTFTGGHGTVVNGPYGSAQWMVQDAEDDIDTLNSYNYSLDKAVEELEKGGWVYNEDGSDYSGSGIRYKKLDDGTMMPLVIEWYATEGNAVSDLLVTSLQKNEDVTKAGMQINQTVGTFNDLINIYQNTDPNAYNYNMLNMGEGFGCPYDTAYLYEPGSASNVNGIEDQELYDNAEAMIKVKEGDTDEFLKKWFGFIKRWNEDLPDIPLYSNDVHDFFNKRVKGWNQNDYDWNVGDAILYTTVE